MKMLTPALLIALSLPLLSQAQNPLPDTILTMSGREIPCTIVDSVSFEMLYEVVNKRGKTKRRRLMREEVFSVRNSKERIFYVQDTLIGDYLTVDEMRIYIAGEQDARACYKTDIQFWTSLAATAGITYAVQGGFISSMLFPLGYTCYQLLPFIRIKEACISDVEKYQWNEIYALGYERVARPKRVIDTLKGGGIGLVGGFALFYLIPL